MMIPPRSQVAGQWAMSGGCARSPHRRDRSIVEHGAEAADPPKAGSLVPMIVAGVRRLEVGRHACGIPSRQVLRQESLADALAPMVGMTRQEAQVGVRLVTGMVRRGALPTVEH